MFQVPFVTSLINFLLLRSLKLIVSNQAYDWWKFYDQKKFHFSFSLSGLLIITYFSRCLAWLEMTLLPKINMNIYLEAQNFAWLKTTHLRHVNSDKEATLDIPTSLCPQTFVSVLHFIAFLITLVQQVLRISCKPVSYKVPGFRKTTRQKTPTLYKNKDSLTLNKDQFNPAMHLHKQHCW